MVLQIFMHDFNRHVHIASISYNEFLKPLKHNVIYAQAN